MKNTLKKFLIISLIIIGIIIFSAILYITFIHTRQTFIAYNSQCSIPSCSSGYIDTNNLRCSDSSKTCYRTCTKELPGSCGSYSSFFAVENRILTYSSSNRGISYNTPFYSVNSNTCYKFYSITSATSSNLNIINGPKSYNIYSANTWNSNSVCSTTSSSSSTTPIYILGRGSDGSSYSAAGRVTDYSTATCSGSYPTTSMLGGESIYLYAATAPWVTGQVDTQTETCTYQCNIDSDCGTDAFVGLKYCKDNNIYQMFRKNACSISTCSYTDTETLVSTCTSGCSNAACITVECNAGDSKCDGSNYYTCSANKWANQGIVTGQCGSMCVNNDIILSNNNYYICTSSTYQRILDVIQLPLEEQQKLINLINQLNSTTQEKARIIDNLTTTLEGQILIISQLNDTIRVKAEIINSLNLNIQQQSSMINSLTSNLNDKIILISQLQSENAKQAQLISQMKLSFTDQAAIINGLNKDIISDSEIIANLNLSVNDQAAIISNLKLTNQQQAELIANLKLSIKDEQTLVSQLKTTVQEQQNLIDKITMEKNSINTLLHTKNIIITILAVMIIVFAIIFLILMIKRKEMKKYHRHK